MPSAVVHRIGNDLLVFERTEEFVRIPVVKFPVILFLRKFVSGSGSPLRRLVFDDAMTGHATNAITSERAIDVGPFITRCRLRAIGRVNELAFEITFVLPAVIIVQPPLAHDAMTLEASIVDGLIFPPPSLGRP